MDKTFQALSPDECFFGLNYKSPILLNDQDTNSSGGNGSQYAANFKACEFEELPIGGNYPTGTFYSELTKEEYIFYHNSNAVNYILRMSDDMGCEIVYSNNAINSCLNISDDPRHVINKNNCVLIRQRECANRGGKYLVFVDGLDGYMIDVEASIATNYFTTPFFQQCSDGCEFLKLNVPSPQFPPQVELVPITFAERSLANLIKRKAFQFKFIWGYYDKLRTSIPSPTSTTIYIEDVTGLYAPADIARQIKIRVPVGNPLVDFITILVSENNSNTWHEVTTIEKYKKYNNSQQMWYERGLAELPGYSDNDCSFDYYFDNSVKGKVVDPLVINRNYAKTPRKAVYLFQIDERLGIGNYEEGTCHIDRFEEDKFRVGVAMNKINTVKGLKGGGVYEFGFVLHWDDGRYSFVNGRRTVSMPRTQDKNAQDFRELFYDFTGMKMPDGVKSVSIVRTDNKSEFVIQWKIESFERIDNTIRLRVQSLIDYNTKALFTTNTKYQYVDGDNIEFVRKGGSNGIFTTAQYGLLQYPVQNPFFDPTVSNPANPPADFFNTIIIKDDGRLADLTINSIIEITRPSKVQDNPVFYEVLTLPVDSNGSVITPAGYFNTFDTYMYKRSISQTLFWENFAPTDYWPTTSILPLSDRGRPWTANRFQNMRREGRSVLINYPNEFNLFETKKTFDGTNGGDILAVSLQSNKIGLAVGENDYFTFQIGNNFLQLDRSGNVTAASGDSIISDPQPKVSGKTGCRYEDIGSILFVEGIAVWIDSTNHKFVLCDYSTAINAAIGKAESWFKRRIQEIATYNKTQGSNLLKIRWIMGYNPTDKCIMITTKAFSDSGINNIPFPFSQQNETLLYHITSGDFLPFVSFTPDAYGLLPLFDGKGCSFVSVFGGTPYIHPILSDKCNEFYGVPCDAYIGITLNNPAENVKRGISIELQGDKMWFVKKVTTDNANFDSEIPASYWDQLHGDKWNASFLFNKNSRGGLFGEEYAEEARGYYINVLFCRDNTDGLKYGTIDNTKRVKYSYIGEIIFKSAIVEQSGFTENT